jgi:hypothetical protein
VVIANAPKINPNGIAASIKGEESSAPCRNKLDLVFVLIILFSAF